MPTRHARLCAVSVTLLLCAGSTAGSSLPVIVGQGETPLFAVVNLAIHGGSFASLPAHVSFVLDDGRVRAVVISFDAREGDRNGLRRDADRVLKRLRVRYGPPASVTGAPDEYKTHIWSVGRRSLAHTVVFTAGLERHFIEADAGILDE